MNTMLKFFFLFPYLIIFIIVPDFKKVLQAFKLSLHLALIQLNRKIWNVICLNSCVFVFVCVV